MKVLIKLAAAGVKTRQGQAGGVRSHAQRAHQSLLQLGAAPGRSLRGFSIDELATFAQTLAEAPPTFHDDGSSGPAVVFEQVIRWRGRGAL